MSEPRTLLGHPIETPRLVVAGALLSAAAAVVVLTSAPWWVVLLGTIGPDLAFLAAVGTRPATRGSMPSRVVPVYNATHHLAGPWFLATAALLLLSTPLAAAALAWHAHLQWDRGVGYGLRDADGRIQRPVRWTLHHRAAPLTAPPVAALGTHPPDGR